MASMTMTASFLGGASAAARPAPAASRRGASLAVRALAEPEKMAAGAAGKGEGGDTRRGIMLAVVAAAAAAVAKVAAAEEEPKRGSADAKKKYAPICVTMPTARICRN